MALNSDQYPIIEISVHAQRFNHQWYPVGSDTPLPLGSLVEPELPPHIRALYEPEFAQEELPFHV